MQLSSFSFLPLQFGAKKAAKPKTEAPKSVKPLAPTQFANKFQEAQVGIMDILLNHEIDAIVSARPGEEDILVRLDNNDDRQKAYAAFRKTGMEVRETKLRDYVTFKTQDGKSVSISVTAAQRVSTC